MSSFLVKKPDGTERMMRYESESLAASLLRAESASNALSRSRVRSRVVAAASRSRRCSSFSISSEGVGDRRPGRKRSVSCDVGAPGAESATPAATITWSPIPPRKGAADKLCVALYCDDTWANLEEFEALIDSLPGNEMPTPSHSNASSTLRRRARGEDPGGAPEAEVEAKEDSSFLKLDDDDATNAREADSASTEGIRLPMRPSTNPRDTPTRHPPAIRSPIRTSSPVGKEDLTLESLHDLEWLQRMEPIDQTILEAHIIWSILTLMVVLLACYSFQHHSL